MNLITVAVVANGSTEELKYTLESIVAQSTEDFDVITVCGGTPDNVTAAAHGYADEYVGFSVLECEKMLIPQCRNLAAANAKTEYIMFVDAGDYLAPESIEKIIKTAEEKKPEPKPQARPVVRPTISFNNGRAESNVPPLLRELENEDKHERVTLDMNGMQRTASVSAPVSAPQAPVYPKAESREAAPAAPAHTEETKSSLPPFMRKLFGKK